MKLKFGAIVTEGRGKIGGHVASKNRSGAYLRTKVTPVNPQSASQLSVRSRFSDLSSAWRGLTADQRAAWNAAVSDYAKTDIFGDIKNPTGAQLYQRLNNNLINVGEAAISTPLAPAAIPNMETIELAAAAGAGTMTLTYAPAIPATMAFLVRATPAVSAGISFVKSEYRQITSIVTADASPYNLAAEYEAKFGSIGPAASKIFLQVVPIVLATGQAGTPMSTSAIVAA
jgi:hypothetical protein